jgi:hypothetical protein
LQNIELARSSQRVCLALQADKVQRGSDREDVRYLAICGFIP